MKRELQTWRELFVFSLLVQTSYLITNLCFESNFAKNDIELFRKWKDAKIVRSI